MVHTSGLQGRLPGCGCHGAPINCQPFRGAKLIARKPKSSSRIDKQTQCASNVSNVKLPATHKEASQRALEQLRASSSIVNSASQTSKHSLFVLAASMFGRNAVSYACSADPFVCAAAALHITLIKVVAWVSGFRYSTFLPFCCAGYAMEKKSSIIAIGLTIHNTPVEIREKLAIPEVHPSTQTLCLLCMLLFNLVCPPAAVNTV